ncbi:C4-type zinc ribbon domain-containing protein [Jatrophihabitans telluris]|uniref:C4-type zinc ribbon domain-containing protein n=1 Tax=Jatrophihabitans telluris TaxID=2038343 RepID=A0ABY4QVJ0_9ACTN|nr:C4-type zinc ribbon domain-containing protein [Jatrophihabitans telluris]UQX87299.1 C4-type zinc ribbon domain-containing protein [Jatrophihabitans telluris]
MIADPFVQLRLLDLQGIDTALNQLAHRRRTLPELATIADCDRRAAEVRAQLVEAETQVADLAGEQRRLEADIDTVRQRADKDQARMTSAGVPAKEISGLQHEVASLSRRQGVLEDELLELMESRETADASVSEFSGAMAVINTERSAAEAARDEVFAEIDDAIGKRGIQRGELAGTIPADLLALYDKVREANGGVGAAMLRQRRCEGCRIELSGSELSAVRAAKMDQVVRCENCRRILVRTDESGL